MDKSYYTSEEGVPFFPAPLDDLEGTRLQSEQTEQPSAELPTLEEIERIHEEARQSGYETGYEAGYAVGKDDVEHQAKRLLAAASDLDTALAGIRCDVAQELSILAREIARRVIHREVSLNPDFIVNVVEDALSNLPHVHASIFLHPEDLELLRRLSGVSIDHAGHRLVADESLSRGGCRISAGPSHLDGTLEERWKRVTGESVRRFWAGDEA